MGARETFVKELQRMGQQNGAWLDPDRLLPLVGAEIDAGATFVNVFHSLITKKEYLLVTSTSTRFIEDGMFKMKIGWMVRHEDLDDVNPRRLLQGSYARDQVVLQARGRTYDFTMGFSERASMGKDMRDMAEHNAEVAANEIKSCLSRLTSPSVDPDLAEFHRSIALAEAGPTPDTESSEHWTTADYERLSSWLVTTYDKGQRKAVWQRRLALGYKLGQGPATREQWFWINALPALAALELGQKGHSMTAVFAGLSDRSVDRSDSAQRTAMERIEKQFFG
jgi:hypothetical protein